LERHLVIAIKGLYRRANYIPNEWKMKIGATHERCTEKYDTSVQIQGLPGRMTGYWKNEIVNGHKTGPYRTSILAMLEYDEFYKDPTDTTIDYSTNNADTFVSAHYIKNLSKNEQHISAIERVPISVKCFDSNFFNVKKCGEIADCVKQILLDKPEYVSLLGFISNKKNKCIKIYKPKTIKQRKIYITDLEEAVIKNIPYKVELPESVKSVNNWQLYIDYIEKKIHVIVCCHDNSHV
jgi:hypothetical protein